MSFHSFFTHHKFFLEKEINQIYASIAIETFASGLISIFVPIYLYKLGYPIHTIIFFFFLVSLSFVIFSFLGARVVSRVGVKHSMLLSTPFLIVYYLGLKALGSSPWLFYILPLLLAWRAILFNYGFHLNYIEHSDMEKRGREVSAVQSCMLIATILAPMIGGFIVHYTSFDLLFLVGSILLLVGILPLFVSKESYEKLNFTKPSLFKRLFSKRNQPLLLSFSGYAVESSIGRIVWPVFLIIVLAGIEIVGVLVTASMVLSLLVFYTVGRLTDKLNKKKLLNWGTCFYFFAWIGRLFADTSFKVLIVDSYKNLSEKVLHVPWAAYSYDLASKRDYFEFIVQREVIFNLSRIVVLPFLILIFYLDFHPFLISFLLAAAFSILYSFLK